jgi:nitrite reductase/ring-hydroxylating ferredoxin subunit
MRHGSGGRLGRRRFLALVGTSAALGGGVGGCSSAVGPAAVGDVPAGNASGLAVGSLTPVGGQPVCIGRDAGGAYAMTLTCTHAGCDMAQNGSVSGQGIFCACHGSEFDANGDVVRGPASQPLDHFAVTMDASGDLTIHGGEIVNAGQRLKIGH